MNLAVFFRYHGQPPTFFGVWDVESNDEIANVQAVISGCYSNLFERGITFVYGEFEEVMLQEGYAKIDPSAAIDTNCMVLEVGEKEIWAEERRHVEEERARLARRTPEEVARDQERWRTFLQEADEAFKAEDAEQIAKAEVAIARGELVLSPDGRLLPARDPALGPGYTPARPPKVTFIAQARATVLSLAVSPDHERLVSCEASGSIQVRDLRSGQELCRRENVSGRIDQLAVSPDGSRVVGIDRSQSVFAWDAQSLTPLVEAASLESYATLLGRATKVWAQGTAKVITKSGVEIYHDHGKVRARRPNQEPAVVLLGEGHLLAISDDGLYTAVMVSRFRGSLISIFETDHLLRANEWADPDHPNSEAINSWGREGYVEEMVFSPDGQTLGLTWAEGIGVTIWDFRKHNFATYGTYINGTYTCVPVTAFAFLGNNRLVVGRGNKIEVLDLELHGA